jgi:hypothetical protein
MSTHNSTLPGQRVQIAGSASSKTPLHLISYAHQLVTVIAKKILQEGGGLVLGAGKEPRVDEADDNSPSVVFDWTVLESAAVCLREGSHTWPSVSGPPIVLVTSEKAVSEIPDSRRALWQELIGGGFVDVEYIQPGARSATMIRDRQAQLGDILLLLGGGTGVEHSAQLYMDRRKPVIPLDLPLGASREDGTGGAVRLTGEARRNINRFFILQEPFNVTAGARFTSLATREGAANFTNVAENVVGILKILTPPIVFYTRLLNPTIDAFHRVEEFFRDIVDPVVKAAGFTRIEVGTDSSTHPFINVAIFENLHFSSIAIVDLTGNRNNCYMELGYAFGRGIRVIITAEEGTVLPFDSSAIPCHFWKHGVDNTERQRALTEFWQKNIDRPPLVS